MKLVMEKRDVNLAGPMNVLSDGGFKTKYGALSADPELLRILREYYAGPSERVEARLAGHSSR